jgi:hypothetical protein
VNVFAINLGGEGELPGVLNQQPLAAADPMWFSLSRQTLIELIRSGLQFLICPNDALALPDECIDVVYTNYVPIDQVSMLGPGVQSSEIKRILKSGGRWIADHGTSTWTKP